MVKNHRVLTGIDAERVKIKSAARRIIQHILSEPIAPIKNTRRDWLSPPPLSAFKHLEPLGWGVSDDDGWFFHPDDCTPDVVWPMSVGMVSDCAGEDGRVSLQTIKTVRTKDVRGYASRFSPYMVRVDNMQQFKEGMVSCAGLMVWLGGRWTSAQKRTLWSGRDVDSAIPEKESALNYQDSIQPALGTAIALRQRYEWAVSLGFENSPSVRLATDPTGIKDIFRIRDLPEGRDRRDALLTWVTDHWRQYREDPDIELYVRRHLRGTIRFSWWGMECEILPAPFDVEQRDKLIAEREAMRLAGVDRRVA